MPPVQMPAGQAHAGLAFLLEAFDLTRDAGCDPWDLAVELSVLLAAGCSINLLRWLMSKGFLEHGIEFAPLDHDRRFIRKVNWLKFSDASCLILSQAGADYARAAQPESTERESLRSDAGQNGKSQSDSEVPLKPHWDAVLRQLTLGKILVKKLRHPAANQELVFEAFEEDCWCERIDDPLPPSGNGNAKYRLHETINSLNDHQVNPCLHFASDGKGEGICWTQVVLPVSRQSANGRSTNGSKKKRRRKS